MRALPLAGIVFSSALIREMSQEAVYLDKDQWLYLYKSYPAANAEPLVGNLALSERRFIRSFEGGAGAGSSISINFLFFGDAISSIAFSMLVLVRSCNTDIILNNLRRKMVEEMGVSDKGSFGVLEERVASFLLVS